MAGGAADGGNGDVGDGLEAILDMDVYVEVLVPVLQLGLVWRLINMPT